MNLESFQCGDDQSRIVETLSALDLPEEGPSVCTAGDLMGAIVTGSDNRGRYFANPYLMRRLIWWQETPADLVARWRDELLAAGEIDCGPIGRSIFTSAPVGILWIVNRSRFARFAGRDVIPRNVRNAVFDRDGWRCLYCGSESELSLDHIVPWSKGGPDTEDNLQTLCRPCNSRKGAKH